MSEMKEFESKFELTNLSITRNPTSECKDKAKPQLQNNHKERTQIKFILSTVT